MSFEIINIPRDNQMLAKKSIRAVNNTGAAIKKGDVAIVDITDDGTPNSVIAPTTLLLINTRIKVVAAQDIASGDTGTWHVKGCIAASLPTGLVAKGQLMVGAVAATGGTNLVLWVANANSKAIGVGNNVNATAAAVVDTVWFDGSDVGYAATT